MIQVLTGRVVSDSPPVFQTGAKLYPVFSRMLCRWLLHLGSGRNLFNVLVLDCAKEWMRHDCSLNVPSLALAWFNRGIDRLDIVTGI